MKAQATDDWIESQRQALRQLTSEMVRQWQRALGGVVAVPSAIALGFATAAMYGGLFIEVGLEVFRQNPAELQARGEPQWRFQGRERPEHPLDEAAREQPRA